MGIMNTKYLNLAAMFLVIFVFGFWLSRTEKPYNSLLLNVHKLVGLGAGIYILAHTVRIHKVTPLDTASFLTVVVTAILFLSMGITGGLVSAEVTVPDFVSKIHKFLPYLTVVSSAGVLYFFL